MAENQLLSHMAVMNYVPMNRLEQLRAELASAGYDTLELNGAGIDDKGSFLAAASQQLFRGEPVANWDSFADVLANHPTLVLSDRSALIWTDAQQMLNGRLRDLVTAADVLTGVSRTIYTGPRQFVTFLVGSGPNFA
jgi:hypothetical protein